MSPRARALLAPPFVVLAFALSLSATLWLEPLTWRIEPAIAAFAVYGLLAAASVVVPAGVYALIAGAYRRRPAAWDCHAAEHRFSVPSSPRQAAMMIIWAWVVARFALRRRFRWAEIRWDELSPGGPPRPAKRNPATIDLRRSATARGRSPARLLLPAGGLHIDSALLAYTIRCYVEHPDRRRRIGDAAELTELQRGFATEDAVSP